jgi:hypothetical protein
MCVYYASHDPRNILIEYLQHWSHSIATFWDFTDHHDNFISHVANVSDHLLPEPNLPLFSNVF